MNEGIAAVLGFGAIAIAVMVVAVLWLRRMRDETAAEVIRELGPGAARRLDPGASCFGVRSVGLMQVRGNGCLALSGDALLFRMWMPRKTVEIPLDSITDVDATRSHLGQTRGVTLLRVRFTNEAGRPDAVAWAVSDLEGWIAALRPS